MKKEESNKASEVLNRSIFWFYEWGLKFVPIFLMLLHWYGTWDFHHNPREIMICIKENEACIIYLYTMAYIFPLLFMMPASFFYKLCWIYRIPFVYIMGVNAIRIYYASFIIRNEMIDADYILILLTIILYIYAFTHRFLGSVKEYCDKRHNQEA